jgi:plasmid stabilization system protein ParE
MKIQITAEAEADLEAIGDYIARENPLRAISFVRELYQLCLDIADMPQAWPVVPRYEHHGVRRRVLGRYLIVYPDSVPTARRASFSGGIKACPPLVSQT